MQTETGYHFITPEEYARLKPLLYHVVDPALAERMTHLRAMFVDQALHILRSQPASRAQSLALTHLEDSLMRAIQGLAMEGEAQLPPDLFVDPPLPGSQGHV